MLRKRFLKYALVISVLIGFSVTTSANVLPTDEEEKIAADKTEHNFGTVKEDGGSVSAIFTIKNTTQVPIMLREVRATCGCTTPDWTKAPIEPGKIGQVTATYNPKGRPGPFEKSITISISVGDKTQTIAVKIKGTVVQQDASL
jgi:hypothetical protein